MRRSLPALAAALLAAPSAWGQCGAPESCLEVHPNPGCVVIECCEMVCEANPLCCEIGWDEACVTLAMDICDGLTCPSPGDCLTAHFTPGCEDSECCHWICAFDAFCCFTAWDAICVEEATLLCGVGPCSIEIPAGAIPEEEPCYERLNDGCSLPDDPSLPIACGEVRSGKYATGAPRDTDWFRFEVDAAGRYRFELSAEFPAQLLLMRGPCLGPLETVGEMYGLPCGTTVIDACLGPGAYACVVSGGVPSRVFRNAFNCDEIDPDNPPDPKEPPIEPSPYGLRYVLRMTCAGCLFGDLDGDGIVGPADLAILLGAWGGGGIADLDGGGEVGASDLALLLGAWSA